MDSGGPVNSKPTQIPSFSDEQSRQILARAADLDRAFAGRLSPEVLRQAALQAGISELAIDQAIEEASSVAKPTVLPDARKREGRLRFWLNVWGVSSIGVLAGVLGRSFQGPQWTGLGDVAFLAAMVLGVVSFALAWDESRDRSLLRYQILNLLLWICFAFGFSALESEPSLRISLEFRELLIFGGGLSALIGTGVIWIRERLRNAPVASMTARPARAG